MTAGWDRSNRFIAGLDAVNEMVLTAWWALCILLLQADEISAVAVNGNNSMDLKMATTDGRTQRFVFQTNHDTILFYTTLLQLQVGVAPGSPGVT